MASKKIFNYALNGLLILMIGFVVGRYFYMQPKYSSGEKAPDIQGQLIDGRSFKLVELQDKFVLVDFWGSWCGPCRRESARLVQFYDKFNQANFNNAKGFEVLSIGIEQRPERWKRAIEKDQLRWPYHIMDKSKSLKFFNSPIANSYGIKEVPTKYLLNPAGEIIAVNQSFDEMEAYLQQYIQ